MTYTYKNELANIKKYYEGDHLQQRYSLLLTGHKGSGKTSILRTCRKPIHVDSFDPGGTRVVKDMISAGDVIADTRFEDDDPMEPTRFEKWKHSVDKRLALKYYNLFGTYMLDSATTWGMSVMAYHLHQRSAAGTIPKWKEGDCTLQKNDMINYIKKLMRIPCDFILTGHLREHEEIISVDKSTGIVRKKYSYLFYTTGQAVVTIPLLFDELYVLAMVDTSEGLKRKLLLESTGQFHASSRLKGIGRLEAEELPDIKAILKKIGLSWEDKPKLDFESIEKEVSDELTGKDSRAPESV